MKKVNLWLKFWAMGKQQLIATLWAKNANG